MTVHLIIAPAAHGKTAMLIDRVRALARDPSCAPRVVVPAYPQVRAWRRRLAKAGGAMGVHICTFGQLYRDVLNAAGLAFTTLSDPVQYRLLRAIVDEARLDHYAPLRDRPGFVLALQELIAELKAGRIWPEEFERAVIEGEAELRLVDLARLYGAYQERLRAEGWADAAGLGWLAAEALENFPAVGQGWSFLAIEGFDNLSPVQVAVLRPLAARVDEMVITLTGEPGDACRQAHKRFCRTRQRLEERLEVEAESPPLGSGSQRSQPALAFLEHALFRPGIARRSADGAVEMIAAPDREGEVRAALRWLKARAVRDGMRLDDVALLARSIEPYRPFIQQTAAEFGLPVHILDGLPLRSNPAVAALLDLLRLALPDAALPWRLTVEAWRSPYFDGSAYPGPDADALDLVARWGKVVGGLAQWEEALAALEAASPRDERGDEDLDVPANVPIGASAAALREKLRRFARRLAPPEGEHPCRVFVAWIEGLVGDDIPAEEDAVERRLADLGVVRRIREGPPALVDRDLAALQAFKDVLRGLVWAEAAVACAPVDFPRFFADLVGAVDAAFYHLRLPADREAALVADVTQVRGIAFRAVAILGLAEGEFPTTIAEDPFLRDADRSWLAESFGLPLELSTDSAEAEYFYEAITRPRERLLLTRPRLADNGAPWQPSPFWEEVRRLVAVEPVELTSESLPAPDAAASWSELLLGLSADPNAALWSWVQGASPERHDALLRAVRVLKRRTSNAAPGVLDGDLTALGDAFGRRFGPQHTWSASRLESYRACPFFFFIGSVLGLEPRGEPVEGLDARQLGNIYHRIFERLYPAVADPTDLEQLLAALPEVAGRILNEAPRREQFRVTAWWARTREEIVENVRLSLVALDAVRGDFVPVGYEAMFGLRRTPPLVIHDGDDRFQLRGFIDRVDRTPDGRVRIIDYKTGGPSAFSPTAAAQGKKLQLALYALAARDVLGLGDPVDGFYWHVRHAQASPFTLEKFGPHEAMELAVAHAWEAVRSARGGDFAPHPPDDGCPGYCPATGFCWRYRPGFRDA